MPNVLFSSLLLLKTSPTKAMIPARGRVGEKSGVGGWRVGGCRLRRGMKRDRDSRATPKLRGFYPQDEQAESIHNWGTLTHSYSGLLCVAFCSWKKKKASKDVVNKHNNVEHTDVLRTEQLWAFTNWHTYFHFPSNFLGNLAEKPEPYCVAFFCGTPDTGATWFWFSTAIFLVGSCFHVDWIWARGHEKHRAAGIYTVASIFVPLPEFVLIRTWQNAVFCLRNFSTWAMSSVGGHSCNMLLCLKEPDGSVRAGLTHRGV